MQIIKNLADANLKKTKTCVTIGVFDGIHAGHRELIKKTILHAKRSGGKSAVFTFPNHPLEFLAPAYTPKNLLTQSEKTRLIREAGIDVLVDVPFDRKLSDLSPENFVKRILIEKLNAECVVVGYDFRFGKEAQGGLKVLNAFAKKYKFCIECVDPVSIYGRIVSSTEIRELLLNGKVRLANRMLKRDYTLSGRVVEGFQRGRKMGFPTANLNVTTQQLIPKFGVYVAGVEFAGKEYFGMLNIGRNPTFQDKRISIEIHIFDFSGHLYGEKIKLSFLKRLRSEKRFRSADELIRQMNCDREASVKLINKMKH